MATNSHHLNPRRTRRRSISFFLVLVAAGSFGLSAPALASAYGWPVKPFDKQHPVRGFFGDPRIGEAHHGGSQSFHFGVDISAPDDTPVYATISGTVELRAGRGETVAVRGPDGVTVFEYWHVVPTVSAGQRVTAYSTVIGLVSRGWEHVHFSELGSGIYLNPLRAGALGPYVDGTKPTVHEFSFERDGVALGAGPRWGRFDLVVEAFDRMPVAAPAPWTGKPVTPALVRWRVVGPSSTSAWRTAADFRLNIPNASAYEDVYARWTRQNKPWRIGRYRFHLARGWDSTVVADGQYRLEVLAEDSAGNSARRSAAFTLRNRDGDDRR